MARPLRIEFPDALYHITSRGDRREAILLDDSDRARFLTLLGEACERFDAAVQAYCLMGTGGGGSALSFLLPTPSEQGVGNRGSCFSPPTACGSRRAGCLVPMEPAWNVLLASA